MIKLSVTWRDGPQSMSFHAVQTDACMGTIWLIAAVVGTHTLRLPSICTRTQIKAILPTGQLGSLISSVYYSNFQQSLQLIHRKQVIPSQPSDKRNNIICWLLDSQKPALYLRNSSHMLLSRKETKTLALERLSLT